MAVSARRFIPRALIARADAAVLERYRSLAARRSRSAALDDATLDAVAKLIKGEPAGKTPASEKLDETITEAFGKLAEADLSGRRPSPTVRRAVVDQFHRLYYHSGGRTWKNTSFFGVPVRKTPLDLWLYQELLHAVRPDVLIEAGTKFGGSAYYFARLFDLLDHGRVITIDVEPQPDRPEHPRLTYLTGSSADPAVADRVRELIAGGRAVVVLDSKHRRKHVLAELRLWSPFVPVGSYIVVEDSHADGHPVTTHIGAGPWDAITDFLAETDDFVIDESMHKFFMTFNPRGYLKRVR
jgi:cephalosporin hydroxylase